MRLGSVSSALLGLAFTFGIAQPAGLIAGGQSPNANQSSAADDEIEGTLDVLVEDSVGGSQVHHFLNTDRGRVRLKEKTGNAELAGLETGSRVKVRGKRNGATELELGGNGSVSAMALASSNTFGPQRVAVIMVNFQDNASAPYTWAHAAAVTFQDVNGFFMENSYGQTSVTGDVFGWYTLPMSASVCDTAKIQTLAEQAATNAGVNLNNYSRRVFAFPQNACTWWGLGNVGGNPSRVWINGAYAMKVVAHELGHNLGEYHSNSQPCESAGCSTIVYGDDRDTMGGPGTGHFNAYQKERIGWLNYGVSPTIQTVGSSGNFFVASLQAPGTNPKALKILKSAVNGDKTFFYVEARTQYGFDNGYQPGVILHTGNEINGNTSLQVDLDPVTNGFDAILDPGQTYSDTTSGFSVRTISADNSGAWVQITYAGTPCTARTPTVTLSPSSSMVQPGVGANYSVTLRNNDDSVCPSSTFDLSMAVPAGWNWSTPQVASVLVAPGASAQLGVGVTPAADATGTASISAMETRPSGPSGSAIASLTVASGLSVAVTTAGGASYQVSARVLAGTNPVSGASVTFTVVGPSGNIDRLTATTNSTGVATAKGRLKPRDARGVYVVTANVTIGAMTGLATGTFIY